MTLGILSHQLEIGGDPTAADAPGAYDSADSAPERGQWCEHQGSPVLPAELSVVSPWLPVVVSKIPIPGSRMLKTYWHGVLGFVCQTGETGQSRIS